MNGSLSAKIASAFSLSVKGLSPRMIIGFAFCHSWAFSSAINVVTPRFAEIGTDNSIFQLLYTLTLLIAGVYLLFCGLFYKRLSKYLCNKTVLLSAGTFALFGTYFIGVMNTNDTFGLSFLLLGSLFMGFGCGTLIMSWGSLFRRMAPEVATFNGVLGFSLAIVLCVAVGFLPTFVRLVSISVLILASAAILVTLTTPLVGDLEKPKQEPHLYVHKGRFAIQLGSATVFYGVVVGALRNLYLNSLDPNSLTTGSLALIVIAILVVILSVFLGIAFLNRSEYWFLHRQSIVGVSVAVLAIPLLGANNQFLSFFILTAGLLLLELFLWILLVEVAFNFRLPVLFVFGIGSSGYAFGGIVGTWLGIAFLESESLLTNYDALGSLSVLFCILMAFCLQPREKDVVRFAFDNPQGNQEDTYLNSPDTSDVAMTQQYLDMVAQENYCTLRTANIKSHNAQAGEERPLFAQRCDKVAKTFLLSEREAEVLVLLAKGRTSSYVQRELYISKGTAKNHLWHIYRKLDIHTQQELIDLVETISLD